MTDVLAQLRRGSWRELEFPVSGRDFGFQHEQVEHRYLFVDVQLVESIGRKNPTYRYTIPFREDIAKGPWENLFTTVYPQFLAACQDRSRGTLIDPVHGAVTAKCVALRELLTVTRRDGIDVEAEFIYAPAEADIATPIGADLRGIDGARNMAGALDKQVAKIPFEQRDSPRPTNSPLDAGSAVLGQIEAGVNRVDAAIADTAFRVEKTTAQIDRLKDPANQPVLAQARRLRGALLDLEERVDPIGARPLRRLTTSVDQTISAVAAKLGMTIQELVRLNPVLARTPLIRAGTPLRVYADAIRPERARAS